jgi:ketosteroid isomerase-like protein
MRTPEQDPRDARISQSVPRAVDENLALVRQTYELWNSGGPDPLVERIWPHDVVFHETVELPDAGVYRGVDAVAGRMRELIEAAGHFQMRVRTLEGCGDYVLAVCEFSAQGASSGLSLTTRICHVLRCHGGRVREFRAHLDCRRARHDYERLCAAAASAA